MSYEETLREVSLRDKQDTMRAVAPLRQAADAIVVDDSDSSIEETAALMTAHVRSRSALG